MDDSGAIDVKAFAHSKGRTITLNSFLYDDTAYLKLEYEKAVKEHYFSKGTNYRNVIDHEMGHIFSHTDKNLLNKMVSIIEREASKNNVDITTFIQTNISTYATWGVELIAELNAMRNGSLPDFAETIWKEALLK